MIIYMDWIIIELKLSCTLCSCENTWFKLYEKKIWKIMWQRLIDIRFNIQFNIANNKK